MSRLHAVSNKLGAWLKSGASEGLFRSLFEALPDSVIFKDAEGRWLEANPVACDLFGVAGNTCQGLTGTEVARLSETYRTASSDCRDTDALAWQFGTYRFEQHVSKNGNVRTYDVIKVAVYDDQQRPKGMLVIGRDLTMREQAEQTRRQAEEMMRKLAFEDELTGITNRRFFKLRLSEWLDEELAAVSRVAVLFVDLDNFKQVNDSLGHECGDEMLRQAAQRLQSCTPEAALVSRWGGDEFLVLLPETDDAGLQSVSNAIQAAFREPFGIDGRHTYLTVSVGVSVYPEDAQEPSALIRNASTALSLAKRGGKNQFTRFQVKAHEEVVARIQHLTDLRRALAAGELTLHYQPSYLASTRRLQGMEALIRWEHPTDGMLMPEAFIPFAEDVGLISMVGEFAMYEACRQATLWSAGGLRDCKMAFNLSVPQLVEPGFRQKFEQTLAATGADPHGLQIEITETVFMHAQQVLPVLNWLQSIGVSIAIDDFGTGFSSLSYLQRLPIDQVKIDRSFVRNLPDSNHDQAIVKAIIDLAGHLNIHVVAEGVETEEQQKTLQGLGCDHMQGYLFGRAMPAAAFEARCLSDRLG